MIKASDRGNILKDRAKGEVNFGETYFLRWNKKRPVTLREHGGVSVLTGNNAERIRKEYKETLRLKRKPERPKLLWDGKTAGRCLRAILEVSQ